MKIKRLLFSASILLAFALSAKAQVSVNSTGSSPDTSAMLDVSSTTKGILVPRMTAAERDQISNPAKGLLIYQTNNSPGFYYNSATPPAKNWVMMSSQWNSNGSAIYYNGGNVGIGTASPTALFEVAGTTKIHSISGPTSLRLQNRTDEDYSQVVFYDNYANYKGYMGYIGEAAPYGERNNTIELGSSASDIAIRPGENEIMRLTGEGNVGIGTSTPNSSAKVDIASTDKGLLIPRMTNAQITTFGSTLGASDKGMIVFNTDDIKLEYWDGTAWKTMVTKTTTTGGSSDGTSFCSEGVTDSDGHQYKTVKIGDQCWMAENLKSTHYADGSAITEHWAYNDDEALAHTYGRLYTWGAVMNGAASSNNNPSGVQGICPDGWHVPSDAEWKELEMTLGMTTAEANSGDLRGSHSEGRKLKETDEAFLWITASAGGTNISGFSALPGGIRVDPGGSFTFIGYWGYWWTSREDDSYDAFDRQLAWVNSGVFRYVLGKGNGFSVRCVRD
jgi:uncharacterized protein (TIGR02145 family)